MTQTKPFCSWLRTIAYSGIGLGLVMILTNAAHADEMASLRRTKTVLAIQAAEPAVVNIEGNKPASARAGDSQVVNGMGAGVIIDPRGYILTNQHVVQDVGRIEVTLSNGREYVGKLIDRDSSTDLALIKIEAGRPLPVIPCGTSSDLMLGEPVIAIGNPYGYHHTVTEGIISALKRDIPVNGVQEYPDLIQTDASINPGNSGGPLLNAVGQMIGINAAVRIGAQGIGFAIPVDRAANVAAQMIARHRARGGLGESPFSIQTTYEDGKSVVRMVGRLGDIQDGDKIKAMDKRPIANRLDFELALLGHSAGSSIEVDVERGSEVFTSTIVLASSRSTSAQLTSSRSVKQDVLQSLGLNLEPTDSRIIRQVDPNYKGGLRVTSVRENSPAHLAQIQVGDTLVGLLEWQTPDWKDLAWVMSRPEMEQATSARFHIVRGNAVYWGNMDIGSSVH